MGIRVKQKGNFRKTTLFLKKASTFNPMPILQRYGEIGVEELRKATPVRTGRTAASWYYDIEVTRDGYTITWNNSNVQNGQNIVLLLVMGHATKRGAWVPPNDFVTPAIQTTFDRIAMDVWREVTDIGEKR